MIQESNSVDDADIHNFDESSELEKSDEDIIQDPNFKTHSISESDNSSDSQHFF